MAPHSQGGRSGSYVSSWVLENIYSYVRASALVCCLHVIMVVMFSCPYALSHAM